MNEHVFIGLLLGGFIGLVWGIGVGVGVGSLSTNDYLMFALIAICVGTCGWAPNCGPTVVGVVR